MQSKRSRGMGRVRGHRPRRFSVLSPQATLGLSRGLVEGQLIFMIIAPSMVFTTGGVELMSLASMARVTRSASSLTGMFD